MERDFDCRFVRVRSKWGWGYLCEKWPGGWCGVLVVERAGRVWCGLGGGRGGAGVCRGLGGLLEWGNGLVGGFIGFLEERKDGLGDKGT